MKNDKHFMDQSLDEIKLLLYLNNAGDCDEKHIVQMYDYFYYKEHLIIVTEVRSSAASLPSLCPHRVRLSSHTDMTPNAHALTHPWLLALAATHPPNRCRTVAQGQPV